MEALSFSTYESQPRLIENATNPAIHAEFFQESAIFLNDLLWSKPVRSSVIGREIL